MTGGPSNPSLGNPDNVRETLERNGPTDAEIEFLLGYDDHGPQRIELNALVSSAPVHRLHRAQARRERDQQGHSRGCGAR